MTAGPDDVSGLTLKAGGGYEAPWITIRGNSAVMVSQLKEIFGLTDEESEGKAPYELLIIANTKLQQSYSGELVTTGLGAKPVSGGGGGASRGRFTKRPAVPTAGGGAQEPEDPNAGLLAAIAEAETEVALREVYARNQAAFQKEQQAKETTLADAFKARRTELRAATPKTEAPASTDN